MNLDKTATVAVFLMYENDKDSYKVEGKRKVVYDVCWRLGVLEKPVYLVDFVSNDDEEYGHLAVDIKMD
jgi:hypothetical protein